MNNSVTKRRTSAFERSRTWTGVLFLLPTVLITAFFIIWPLIQVIRYSFTDWDGIQSTMNYIGLENYKNLPSMPGFADMCKATIIFALIYTVLVNIVAFLMALVLDKKGKWRISRGLMRGLWFFPCLLSGIVIGILWSIMFNYNNGILNFFIKAVRDWAREMLAYETVSNSSFLTGFFNLFNWNPINWLESEGMAMFSVIVASVWAGTGMCIIIFLAGLQSIDEGLYEAAAIDGASSGQRLWHITVPMMAPSITINVITTSIAAFKAYELPKTITNGGPGYATTLITSKIMSLGFTSANTGMGSALSVVLILIITLISLIQLIYLRKREDIY